jgi:hypothetical protein
MTTTRQVQLVTCPREPIELDHQTRVTFSQNNNILRDKSQRIYVGNRLEINITPPYGRFQACVQPPPVFHSSRSRLAVTFEHGEKFYLQRCNLKQLPIAT